MKYSDFIFNSEQDIVNLIEQSEQNFKKQIHEAVETVLANDDAKFVTLTGPSASGKTTSSTMIVKELAERGKRVKLISIDDFYRDRHTLIDEAKAEGREVDYESAKALNFAAFSDFVNAVLAGKEASLLHYDFDSGFSQSNGSVDPNDYDIFMFEGIQGLYPEILSLFGDAKVVKLYICVFEDIESPWCLWKGIEIRLLRRIIRDYHSRAASAEHTFELWTSVIRNEKYNITPYIDQADCIIDSGMLYEICVLKGDLINTLGLMSESDIHYISGMLILQKLSRFPLIEERYVPADSVIQEFIKDSHE